MTIELDGKIVPSWVLPHEENMTILGYCEEATTNVISVLGVLTYDGLMIDRRHRSLLNC